jgi:guanylate cyclase
MSGNSGLIQITRATYELVHQEFVCEPRGTVSIKGKGEMEIWHVMGQKDILT